MEAEGWYLLAYDIADPKRLRRVHYRLCQKGIPIQKSVFVLCATGAGLTEILDEIERLMHRREDDLRAYPIRHPGDLWFQGRRAVTGPLLQVGQVAAAIEAPKPAGLRAWIARLRGQHRGE